MSPTPEPELTGLIRFGAFELDPRSGTLRKHGIRIRLQEQPFRVLLALLERPGEPVAREELQRKIWPEAEFGDFDHSLNIAINKIRQALGDSFDTPRFVETLPRRGYRFMAEIEAPVTPAAIPVAATVPKPHKRKWIPIAGGAVCLSALITGMVIWLLPSAPPPELEIRRLTNDNSHKFGPVLSDGARLYFQVGSDFDSHISQLPLSGGEPSKLPVNLPPGPYSSLLDITPDGQELLLAVSEKGHPLSAPLWTLRICRRVQPESGHPAFGRGEVLAGRETDRVHGRQRPARVPLGGIE
jgi:DNA-binding winged helix-turn-helix (wHTH) protein